VAHDNLGISVSESTVDVSGAHFGGKGTEIGLAASTVNTYERMTIAFLNFVVSLPTSPRLSSTLCLPELPYLATA
jgi:hypothetical protein